jgi:hypothetical protein
VSFRARFVPQRFLQKCFRFITKQDTDGNLHWFQEPMTNPCGRPRTTIIWAPPRHQSRSPSLPNLPPELR